MLYPYMGDASELAWREGRVPWYADRHWRGGLASGR